MLSRIQWHGRLQGQLAVEEETHGKTVRQSRTGRRVAGTGGRKCASMHYSFVEESLLVPKRATLPD